MRIVLIVQLEHTRLQEQIYASHVQLVTQAQQVQGAVLNDQLEQSTIQLMPIE